MSFTLRTLVITCFLSFILATAIAYAEEPRQSLGLQDYLSEVLKTHAGLQGALLDRNGAELSSKSEYLTTTPHLIANVKLTHDTKQDPLFLTSSQTLNNYSLGVGQLTTFGTQAKLSYNFDYSNFNYLPSTGRPSATYNQGRPELDLVQSLWRNGFGSETRAKLEAVEASAMATSYSQSYQARLILSQAESAYWNLSLARDAVRVAKDVMDRAQNLYDWSARRAKLRLADDSDRIQAEALLKLRQLDYQQALDNQRVSSRNFNQLRGDDSDVVAEEVTSLGNETALPLVAPARASLREDVLSAQEQQRAAIANAAIETEKAKPTLELFANLSLNGSDQTFTPTISQSFKTDQPTVTGGVRLSMPLDFGLMSDTRKGYALQQQGAERLYQRKFFEQESEWHNLSMRLNEAKYRCQLAKTVETIQKQKLKVERDRLNRGKSTTFNVIQFEQDAAQSELNTLRAQNEILQIISQMKTFGGPI